jgi:nitrate/nitrite transporter NarK
MLYLIAFGSLVVALVILGVFLYREQGRETEDAGLLADLNHQLARDRLRASANRDPTSRAHD